MASVSMQPGSPTTSVRTWWLAAAAGSLAMVVGCNGSPTGADCADGGTDPACEGAGGPDGAGERLPQCMDGIDNDGDGHIDYPNDPGCTHPHDDSEEDDCPDGPLCPQCSNGIDDDGDGNTDWPDDPGCTSAADPSEIGAECGDGVKLRLLPEDGEVIGTMLAGEPSRLSSASCGGDGGETVYRLTVTEPSALAVTTAFPETTLQTTLYLRSTCADAASELGCADTGELFVERLDPGDYYVVVDAREEGGAGSFKLGVESFTPRGEACAPASANCAPGLSCRPHFAGEPTTCQPPECSDGVDNDGDGKTDFPDDPGCTSPTDTDESSCEFGNPGDGCFECGDGIDNDGDGKIDYPDDPGCESAGDDSELNCESNTDPIVFVTTTPVTGTTSGKANDFSPSSSVGCFSNAPDVGHFVYFPGDLANLTINTNGSSYDTILYIRPDSCTSADLSCNDAGGNFPQSLISLNDVAAGGYFVIVDGFSTNSGSYVLNLSATVKTGEPCDPDQVSAGIATCAGTSSCTGGTCQ
jgi:large repetitive protein